MRRNLAAVVLAAGAGTRLRPLTEHRPKALCPVANVPLVDLALERVMRHCTDVAVNIHHGRDQMAAHLRGRNLHLQFEQPVALGTAGALGALRGWLDGRDVLVANADVWHTDDLDALMAGWDGERMRLLVVADRERADFGVHRYAGVCLLPWRAVRDLPAEPAGLYEVRWAAAAAAGALDLEVSPRPFIDCGTPADYLAANLAASGGRSVVGDGAVVAGTLVRSVVWPGGVVARGERLVEAIRIGTAVTVAPRFAAGGVG